MNRKQQPNLPLTPDMIPIAPKLSGKGVTTAVENLGGKLPRTDSGMPDKRFIKAALQLAELQDRYNAQRHIQREEYLLRMQFNSILAQAKELKKLYPDFDLAEELKNPVFARLLAPGIGLDLQTVYETLHHQALKRAAMIESGLMLTKAIQSGRTHPIENGLDSRYFTVPLRTDPASLTPEERKDIRNRVMKGERVTF